MIRQALLREWPTKHQSIGALSNQSLVGSDFDALITRHVNVDIIRAVSAGAKGVQDRLAAVLRRAFVVVARLVALCALTATEVELDCVSESLAINRQRLTLGLRTVPDMTMFCGSDDVRKVFKSSMLSG